MEDNTSINNRIQSIINEVYNGNVSKFCREVGVKQPTMNTILGERKSKPSYDILYAILNAITLKSISIEWLITGKGTMLKSESQPPRPETLGKNAIKYYPAVNGSMGGVQFLDCPDETSIDIILPGFAECKFAINAYGDSMYPVIKSGQVVLLMEWKESFIDWGHIYMVVTKSGYRTIKYVRPSEKEGFIRCESENKESNPAFDIEMEDIHKLFLVKGWVCRDTI